MDGRTLEEIPGWMERLVGKEPDRDAPADRLGWTRMTRMETRMERLGCRDSEGVERRV